MAWVFVIRGAVDKWLVRGGVRDSCAKELIVSRSEVASTVVCVWAFSDESERSAVMLLAVVLLEMRGVGSFRGGTRTGQECEVGDRGDGWANRLRSHRKAGFLLTVRPAPPPEDIRLDGTEPGVSLAFGRERHRSRPPLGESSASSAHGSKTTVPDSFAADASLSDRWSGPRGLMDPRSGVTCVAREPRSHGPLGEPRRSSGWRSRR